MWRCCGGAEILDFLPNVTALRQQKIALTINPSNATMAENAPPAGGTSGDAPGLPYYEKSRQHLKELLAKRRNLERQLVRLPHATMSARRQRC